MSVSTTLPSFDDFDAWEDEFRAGSPAPTYNLDDMPELHGPAREHRRARCNERRAAIDESWRGNR
jgi:hypothetical protein